MTQRENKPEFQRVLETLKCRLENKLAANRKLPLDNNSSLNDYCRGLEDALVELSQVEDLAQMSCGSDHAFIFPILESRTPIVGSGVTHCSWFIRSGLHIIRSEVYQLEDGSVVAYQDTVDGQSGLLHMDMTFKTLHEGEDDFNAILRWSGVLNPDKIPVFYAGR